jgi:hypothetical protein
MKRSHKFSNPFYSLLLGAGIAFALTATAYCVMAFRERAADPSVALEAATASSVEHPLMAWMSRHGETALMAELAVLAICTFAAIGTDDYWQRRLDGANTNASKELH